jgi:hypothetical protein
LANYTQNALDRSKGGDKGPVENVDPKKGCNKADANPKDASNPKIKDDSKEAADAKLNVHVEIQIKLSNRISR